MEEGGAEGRTPLPPQSTYLCIIRTGEGPFAARVPRCRDRNRRARFGRFGPRSDIEEFLEYQYLAVLVC